MNIQWWQILLLTLYAGFAFYDGNNTTFGTVKPTMAGFFAGLILGDIKTGLMVGGTLNLLVLGIGNFGGASIPDYMTGALLGTVFAITSGQGAEFGITLAIPIGLLMIQLDILARFSNTFFQHRAEKYVELGAALYAEMDAQETQEARIYKALDNLEAVLQHNEADLSTWLPLEYTLQLTYGSDRVKFSPWLTALKAQLNQDTQDKIAAAEGKR